MSKAAGGGSSDGETPHELADPVAAERRAPPPRLRETFIAYGEPLLLCEHEVTLPLTIAAQRVDTAACVLLVVGLLSVPSFSAVLALAGGGSIRCCHRADGSVVERALEGVRCLRACCLGIVALVCAEVAVILLLFSSGTTGVSCATQTRTPPAPSHMS